MMRNKVKQVLVNSCELIVQNKHRDKEQDLKYRDRKAKQEQVKAYLDIETDREGNISVIGISIGNNGFRQFVGKAITSHKVENCLRSARTIVTFNGDSFDLPRLKNSLTLTSKQHIIHMTFSR